MPSQIRISNQDSTVRLSRQNQFDQAINHAMQPSATSRQRRYGLIMAAGEGNIEAVKTIIDDFGVSPNAIIPGERKCPLHAAVIFRQLECVEALLGYGADVTLCDKYGKSAIDIVIETTIDFKTDPVYQLLAKHVSASEVNFLPNV